MRKGTTILDVIGQIGYIDSWGTGLLSTQNNTLRRKSSIIMGDINGSDFFDPALEWEGFGSDNFSGLGYHLAAPSPNLPPSCSSVEDW